MWKQLGGDLDVILKLMCCEKEQRNEHTGPCCNNQSSEKLVQNSMLLFHILYTEEAICQKIFIAGSTLNFKNQMNWKTSLTQRWKIYNLCRRLMLFKWEKEKPQPRNTRGAFYKDYWGHRSCLHLKCLVSLSISHFYISKGHSFISSFFPFPVILDLCFCFLPTPYHTDRPSLHFFGRLVYSGNWNSWAWILFITYLTSTDLLTSTLGFPSEPQACLTVL